MWVIVQDVDDETWVVGKGHLVHKDKDQAVQELQKLQSLWNDGCGYGLPRLAVVSPEPVVTTEVDSFSRMLGDYLNHQKS